MTDEKPASPEIRAKLLQKLSFEVIARLFFDAISGQTVT